MSASTLPPQTPGRFTDATWYDREKASLWHRSWLVVGRLDEVAGSGQYFTWEHTGVPLIIIGSADGTTRAFYNSCRHRGAPVVREARGRSRALRCQYHSWTYDTLGRLVSVPDERDFVDLRLEERPLVPAELVVESGWLFVNEAPSGRTPPARGLPTSPELRVAERRTWRIQANWKTVLALLSTSGIFGSTPAAVSPNGAASDDLAAFCWPVDDHVPGDHERCDLELVVLAPDWGDEDSPAEVPGWGAQMAELDARVRTLAAAAARRQDELRAGGSLTEGELDLLRALDAQGNP